MKRAGDRIRTGDNQLGKLALYQLSYARGELRFGFTEFQFNRRVSPLASKAGNMLAGGR